MHFTRICLIMRKAANRSFGLCGLEALHIVAMSHKKL